MPLWLVAVNARRPLAQDAAQGPEIGVRPDWDRIIGWVDGEQPHLSPVVIHGEHFAVGFPVQDKDSHLPGVDAGCALDKHRPAVVDLGLHAVAGNHNAKVSLIRYDPVRVLLHVERGFIQVIAQAGGGRLLIYLKFGKPI